MGALHDEEVCWACDVLTPKGNLEWHHFVPKLNGGSNYKIHTGTPAELLDQRHNMIPLCERCHSLVDRVSYNDWMLWAWVEETKKPAPAWAKVTMLKQWALLFTMMRRDTATP